MKTTYFAAAVVVMQGMGWGPSWGMVGRARPKDRALAGKGNRHRALAWTGEIHRVREWVDKGRGQQVTAWVKAG